MKKQLVIILTAAMTLAFAGCSKKTVSLPSSASYSTFETTCLGVEHDGSQTLRAWGRGANKGDAIEQAKKNAVYDVLFKGIKSTGQCNQRPLVLEVNARERYAAYFNPFFADGGEYRKFVKEVSANDYSRVEAKGSQLTNYGVIVIVDREKLRRQLEKDGVIKEGTQN